MNTVRSGIHWLFSELRYALTALAYFTRIPVPRWVGYEAHYLNAAARYFPLIGLLVGAVAAGAYWLALHLWTPPIAVLLSMAATLLLTGAFHEDGLADSMDAFGGGYTREDTLRIMHDSRIGTFGTVALLVVLALKWQALVALPPPLAVVAMVAAHGTSRLFAIAYLRTLPYVRPEGKAKPVASELHGVALAMAVVCGGAPLLGLPWPLALAIPLALLPLWFWLGRYFRRRLGGYTGDCLGMAQQLAELAILLMAAAWMSF
ncbi:adenosylcobinamide-GDP ribazoletransferase [Imbroritus primus]|uniref:Adenosylcobinamide-GDP ribazoletransferase n=1 Tax=Imbroritus primus TaxID=3058603 RepID=A0ACD3SKK0_9BURK|nr:adenosylcobinamide-GDP ribazoletransferase [Burkholderiaceae bacterium PBA]